MNSTDKEINTLIMKEVGFDIGPMNRLIDQDTGEPVIMNGSEVIAPGCFGGSRCIEFDPYNNRKMMSTLFSYFSDKSEDETGVGVSIFYQNNLDNGKSELECRMSDNTVLTSKPYKRDSLRYADIMMQMNSGPGEAEDLSQYDFYPERKPIKKKKKG